MSLSVRLGSGPKESSSKYSTLSMAVILSKDSYVLNEEFHCFSEAGVTLRDKQEVNLKLTLV